MQVNFSTVNFNSKSFEALQTNRYSTLKSVPTMNSNLKNVSFSGAFIKGMDLVKKSKFSPLEAARLSYQPKLPAVFKNGILALGITAGAATTAVADSDKIKELFPKTYGQPALTFDSSEKMSDAKPHKVGVILSGGQASGGHNVITGLYDALKGANPQTQVYGFLGGPKGLIDGKYIELTDDFVNDYRNQGGFDMIGSGRDKLEKEEQFESVLKNCKNMGIDAITIIGGDDSNTNAAMLAEWMAQKGEDIKVIGCPKTIDGDLKNAQIETSFGFDTATKTYSESVGNIERDMASSKKYWDFIKVMGRSASHVALEIALQTHPNMTLISEEVEAKNMTLGDVVNSIADSVVSRAKDGKNYGVIVITEGVIEFIPEFKSMISNLDKVLPEAEKDAQYISSSMDKKYEKIASALNEDASKLFKSLPSNIKTQLLTEKRDSHGNFPVSALETDKLLIEMVKTELAKRKEQGTYDGKFAALSQFCGYEGRAGLPSNFDADYCYSLGYSAATLINSGKTGYIASVSNLKETPDKWIAGGSPVTMMMNMEERNGKMKPVIQKALVDLNGPVFAEFAKNRENWMKEDSYVNPGPIQFFGPEEMCDKKTMTLALEQA